MSDQKPDLKGTDAISFRDFIRDLTWNEIHLFWMGLYAGFVAVRPRKRQEPKPGLKEKLKWELNQWYFQTGYVAGYILKATVVGGIAVNANSVRALFGF